MTAPTNEMHQRLLDAAEDLFARRGYKAVRLRDIGAAVGLKHSALYYYAPEGKEQLYVQVMTRSFHRHQKGMARAIASVPDGNLARQLMAAAGWLLDHPPLHLGRMTEGDFAELSADAAQSLGDLAYNALRTPLAQAITQAQANGAVRATLDADVAALSFLSLVDAVHASRDRDVTAYKTAIVDGLVDLILHGLLVR